MLLGERANDDILNRHAEGCQRIDDPNRRRPIECNAGPQWLRSS